MRNFWDMNDIDSALSAIKGKGTIDDIRDKGALGITRWVLITDCCAMMFANPKIQHDNPDSAQLLGQVYRYMTETGFITPKE